LGEDRSTDRPLALDKTGFTSQFFTDDFQELFDLMIQGVQLFRQIFGLDLAESPIFSVLSTSPGDFLPSLAHLAPVCLLFLFGVLWLVGRLFLCYSHLERVLSARRFQNFFYLARLASFCLPFPPFVLKLMSIGRDKSGPYKGRRPPEKGRWNQSTGFFNSLKPLFFTFGMTHVKGCNPTG